MRGCSSTRTKSRSARKAAEQPGTAIREGEAPAEPLCSSREGEALAEPILCGSAKLLLSRERCTVPESSKAIQNGSLRGLAKASSEPSLS